MKRLFIIIFLSGIFSCSWAQSKEQNILTLLEAYSKQEKLKVYVNKQEEDIAPVPERLPESTHQHQPCPPSAIKITVEGGKLFTQQTSLSPDYVRPEDYYFLKVEDADIEFTKDEKGDFTLIIRLH